MKIENTILYFSIAQMKYSFPEKIELFRNWTIVLLLLFSSLLWFLFLPLHDCQLLFCSVQPDASIGIYSLYSSSLYKKNYIVWLKQFANPECNLRKKISVRMSGSYKVRGGKILDVLYIKTLIFMRKTSFRKVIF